MPNGEHQVDVGNVGSMVAGGFLTAVGSWLWKRLVTIPRNQPMSVRQLKDLISQAEANAKNRSTDQDLKIDQILHAVDELRNELNVVKGTANGLAQRVAEIAAASGYGD